MNFKVTLSNGDDSFSIVVDSVKLSNGVYRFEGTDPYAYPERFHDDDLLGDTRVWTSSTLTLHLTPDDPWTFESAESTSDSIPDPEPEPMF